MRKTYHILFSILIGTLLGGMSFAITIKRETGSTSLDHRELDCEENTVLPRKNPRSWENQLFTLAFSVGDSGLIDRKKTSMDMRDFGDPLAYISDFRIEKVEISPGIVRWDFSSDGDTDFSGYEDISTATLRGQIIETLQTSRLVYAPEFREYGDAVGWVDLRNVDRRGELHIAQYVFSCKWFHHSL